MSGALAHPPEVEWALRLAMAGDFGAVRPDRGQWMLDFWVEGRRYRVRRVQIQGNGWVALRTQELAELVLDSIRQKVRAGTPRLAALAPYLRREAEVMTFRRAWERFVLAKWQQGRHGGRQLSRERTRHLNGYLERGHLTELLEVPIHALGYRQLEEWRDKLFERGLAPKSVKHLIADVGTCLRWLARRQEIERVPELPDVRVPEYVARIPSAAEVTRLLDAIPWRVRGQWLARSLLGLRPSEAWRASVSDWRFEPEPMRVSDGSTILAHTLTVRAKGERVRLLPVPADWPLSAWIAEHVKREDALQGDRVPLFPNPNATEQPPRWTNDTSRRAWLHACKATGLLLSPRRPRYRENEAMRHAFATWAAADVTLDLLRLTEFMGHSDPRTTRRYRKLGAGALVGVVKR